MEYLVEENRVLRRMRFSDNQRCRLAPKQRSLAAKILAQVATIVTTRDIVGLALEVDCTEVRWERKPKSRPAKDSNRDCQSGHPYG
jgi:hypothetical protein